MAPLHPERRRRTWLLLAPLALILAIAGWALLSPTRTRQPEAMPRTVPLSNLTGISRYPAFSPNGDNVVFSWLGPPRTDSLPRALNLFTQPVANGSPVRLTNSPTDDVYPQWSPDGTRIAFQRNSKTGNELRIVPVSGGPGEKIADIANGLSWSPIPVSSPTPLSTMLTFPPASLLVRSKPVKRTASRTQSLSTMTSSPGRRTENGSPSPACLATPLAIFS